MNVLASDRRSPLGLLPREPTPRLYDCVVEALRSRHYRRRTEEAYHNGRTRGLRHQQGHHSFFRRTIPYRLLSYGSW